MPPGLRPFPVKHRKGVADKAAIGPAAFAHGYETLRAGNMRDPAATELDQPLDGKGRALKIVGAEGHAVGRALGESIDDRHG